MVAGGPRRGISRDALTGGFIVAILLLGLFGFVHRDDIRERLSDDAPPEDAYTLSKDERGAVMLVRGSAPYRQDHPKRPASEQLTRMELGLSPDWLCDPVRVTLGWVVLCEQGTYFVSGSDGTVSRR